MKQRGRLALSIVLGIVMALGMCPMYGIAETIDVESDEDEVVVDVESEGGSKEEETQPEEELVTTESLEAQDADPVAESVAIVEWYSNPSGPDNYGKQYYPRIGEAINSWKDWDPVSVLVLLRSAKNNANVTDLNGRYVTLDLNGYELDMSGNAITVSGHRPPKFFLKDYSEQQSGMLKDCTLKVDKGTHINPPSAFMSGGTITNTTGSGSGVNVGSGGTFDMSGGSVKGCTGGGVNVGPNDTFDDGSTFVMTGGSVEDCKVGGVNVYEKGTFQVSGAPVVAGNTMDGQARNVWLGDTKTITIAGPLTDGAHIGVTTQTTPTVDNPVVLTNGYSQYNQGVDPAKYFTSDDNAYYVTSNKNGEAVLKVRQHNWSYAASGNVLKATCNEPRCSVGEQTLTLSVADKTYDGTAAAANITTSAGWTSDNELSVVPDVSGVTYYQNGTVLDTAPSNVGDYTAELIVSGMGQDQATTLRTSFHIRQALLTVTARDKTIAFGEAPTNAGVAYAGFVNGEDASVLSGTLVYDYGGYKAKMSAGRYAITPSGLASGNYAIAYKAGTLTVTPKAMPEPNPPKPLPDPVNLPDTVSVRAVVHVQNKGTMKAVTGVGRVVGTTGRSRRLESLRLSLRGKPISGGIEYCAYVQGVGWQGWRTNGGMAGTQGKARRVEAIRIGLTGKMGQQYDVYYRVHVQNLGWMAWTKNGARAGTRGKSLRVEAVQVVIVRKGSPAPGRTYNGVAQTYGKAFVKKQTFRRSVGR